MSPPAPDGVDRAELRELARRGLVVERDGQWFHADALDAAAELAARLLAAAPDGFTVSEFRDAAGVTRKHALPLVSELDARGITRRRGDLRVAGPRLKRLGAPPDAAALVLGEPAPDAVALVGGHGVLEAIDAHRTRRAHGLGSPLAGEPLVLALVFHRGVEVDAGVAPARSSLLPLRGH